MAAKTEISFVDYFVDGQSFETSLRQKFPDAYSRGRYKETQVPTLTGGLDSLFSLQGVIDGMLPPDNETRTPLIYRCQDGCCAYAYVEVQRRDTVIVWSRFGLNGIYTGNAERIESGVDWLEGFKPLHFALDEYESMMEAFAAARRVV